MSPLRRTHVVGVLAILLPASAIADAGRWESIGPFGRTPIQYISVDPTSPSSVFAASADKVFRTLDGSETWSIVLGPSPPDFAPLSVRALAVAGTSPSTVYVSLFPSGVLRSVDAGSHWTRIGFGFGLYVGSLAADPLAPTTVYAGTNVGVYKTVDGGETWFAANDGLDAVTVSALAIDPTNPSIIYAADSRLTSTAPTLFKSQNGGLSWLRIDEGLKRTEDGFAVQALAVDPISPSQIYASELVVCRNCVPGPGGLFRSSDGGVTWDEIASPSVFDNGLVAALAVAPTTPPTLMAGVKSDFGRSGAIFVSANAGVSWDRTPAQFAAPILTLSITPSDPASVYAGVGSSLSQGGSTLLKTTDAGRTWRKVEHGLVSLDVLGLAVSPTSPQVLFAAAINGGVFRSTDSGLSWERFVPQGLDLGSASAIVIDPTTASTFYVISSGAISRILDSGEWTSLNGPDFPFSAQVLVIDPGSASTLYAGARELSGSLGPGVLRSIDGGRTWEKRSNGLPQTSISAIVVDPTSSSTLYAAPTFSAIFKSTDTGLSWRPAGNGMPPNVRSLAIDPATSAILYAGADSGLFRSADSGATWFPVGSGGLREIVYSVVVDSTNPSNVYAATCTSVFRSVDRGLTWRPIGGGPCVQVLALDPARGQTLFGGTLSSSVWSTILPLRVHPRDETTRVLPFRR